MSFGQQLLKLQKKPCRKPELDALVKSSLGKMSIISSEPKLAFSALLFGFIRQRVCYSTCWGGLQREGYMLKGYQAVIARISKSSTPCPAMSHYYIYKSSERHP